MSHLRDSQSPASSIERMNLFFSKSFSYLVFLRTAECLPSHFTPHSRYFFFLSPLRLRNLQSQDLNLSFDLLSESDSRYLTPLAFQTITWSYFYSLDIRSVHSFATMMLIFFFSQCGKIDEVSSVQGFSRRHHRGWHRQVLSKKARNHGCLSLFSVVFLHFLNSRNFLSFMTFTLFLIRFSNLVSNLTGLL